MFECNKPGCGEPVSASPLVHPASFNTPASLYCEQHLSELTEQGYFTISKPQLAAETIPVSENN